jgi:hypothetical protein
MKVFKIIGFFILVYLAPYTVSAQNIQRSAPATLKNEPWKQDQLIEPAVLAEVIKNKTAKPLIFNIGVVENIPGAKKTGAASEKKNLLAFEKAVQALPKNANIVVYCGCCPFNKCPNVRPAINSLKRMGYTNWKLLNLPTNIHTDWISKGYPLEKK